ncbi:MAG: hypothetical protein AVDCRST_MAG25-2069, partial [uncultured Rubrobacteraceae bacterium]
EPGPADSPDGRVNYIVVDRGHLDAGKGRARPHHSLHEAAARGVRGLSGVAVRATVVSL